MSAGRTRLTPPATARMASARRFRRDAAVVVLTNTNAEVVTPGRAILESVGSR